MRQLSRTKYALRSLVQAYLHCRHSARLRQRYTSRNSWHCDKTAAIGSENRRSFSIRNNFPGPLSPFYATQLAFGVAQNRFQEHNLVSTHINSEYNRLKIFEVVLGCRHQLDNQCQKVVNSVFQMHVKLFRLGVRKRFWCLSLSG